MIDCRYTFSTLRASGSISLPLCCTSFSLTGISLHSSFHHYVLPGMSIYFLVYHPILDPTHTTHILLVFSIFVFSFCFDTEFITLFLRYFTHSNFYLFCLTYLFFSFLFPFLSSIFFFFFLLFALFGLVWHLLRSSSG